MSPNLLTTRAASRASRTLTVCESVTRTETTDSHPGLSEVVTWLDSVVLLRNYLEKNLESRDCLEAMWTIGNFGILVWGLCKLGGQLGPNSGAEVSSLGTEL